MPKVVHVIDVESGNLQSLTNAIKYLGDYEVKFIHNGVEFREAFSKIEKLVFPGVGNFDHFVKQVHLRDLLAPIREYIASDRPLMGICVGLQVFFDESEEGVSDYHGLGYMSMKLKKFDSHDSIFKLRGLRKAVPHIGWNSVAEISINGESLSPEKSYYGVNTTNKYYFVHSYAAIISGEEEKLILKKAKSEGWNIAFAQYGSEKFIAAMAFKNFFATQFHPEKSGIAGLQVINAFLNGQVLEKTENSQVNASPRAITPTLSGVTRRIIACLDVRTNDEGDLVVTKGDQYNVRESSSEGNHVRNLGKPVELATRYYRQGADEVTFLNITSFRNSPLKDLPMLEVLKLAAKEIFVPLTVGGGIKDMTDPETNEVVPAEKVADIYFRSGADKVSIGSDAVFMAETYYKNNRVKDGTSSIERISGTFGNQAVVISVDPKRVYVLSPSDTTMQVIEIKDESKYGPNGERYCYYQVTSQGGRAIHELGAVELCIACEDLGAGEILLNSIDHDGSNKGYNFELINQVKRAVSIPVIASSGAGIPQHFREVFELDCNVDAALGAGLFHREEYKVNDVKEYLQKEAGMDVRLETRFDI